MGYAEGTKELMPTEAIPTRILLDPATTRDPFMLYSAYLTKPDYRLYIHIQNPATERIYFGFGQQRITNNNTTTETHVNWRIHQPNSPYTVECTGLTPIHNTSPTPPDPGYISTYQEAYNGPNNINPLGYNPLICTPTGGAGDYFMTIEATAIRTFDFFDVTVVDISTATPTAIPGRVFSKCWQIRNPQNGPSWFTFSGNMYIYSTDGIVTKLNPNSFEGRDFSYSCNESGCYPIGPTHNAQQARQSQPGPLPHNYPQYKVFLNNPDQVVYPDGIIGHLVDGSVTTETFCNTGTVNFNFQTLPVNAVGTVEIDLLLNTLVPALTNRILITNNVPGGFYTIVWDGLDGAGVQVPSGSTFPFVLKYTNGLTNMPLWDVENNVNGFIVTLIRPVQVPPLADPAFYWDDVLVSGTSVTTSPGCTTPPSTSCHAWSGDWGDNKTINTWWYLVSNSTANIALTYKKGPATLVPVNPPTQVCQGGTATFTVTADPNSAQYHCVWDGGALTTILPTITITFTTALPGASTVSVNGINADCGAGPVTSIPITINPLPVVTISGPNSVCYNSTTTYTTETGKINYNWSVTGGNIITNTGSQISVQWTSSGNQTITVIYSNTTGCSPSTPASYPVTVHPLPAPTISGLSSVCEGASGVTYSTQAAMSGYTWTVSSGATTTAGGTGFDFITLTWTTPGIHTLFVNYTDANGCTALAPSSVTVTVNQLPTVLFTYVTPGSCSGVPLNIQLSSNVSGATFAWTATGSSPNLSPQFTSGTGDITIPFTNSGTAIENVVFSVVPSATGCSPVAPVLSNPVLIYPVPDLAVSPAALTVCSNSQASISFSSVVLNTTYAWTATGGAGITPATLSGTGNIAETFVNSSAVPATVSFAIVPTANGCSNPGLPPYLLTVNPKPGVLFPASPANPQTICSGTASANVNLQSTVNLPGNTYAWTAAAFDPVNPTASITGFTATGSGNIIPGETISSTLPGPGVVKYEVTATFANGGATCPGDPSEYQVIVNPAPTVILSPADPAGQAICSGTSSQAISFTPNVNPVIYSWQAVEVAGINPPVMNGTSSSIPSQVLTVTGAVQGHVKYKVTPTFLGSGSNSCLGSDSYSTIFVNPLPAPVIGSTSPQTVCELQTNLIYSTPNVTGNSYTWVVTGAASVTNANTNAVTVNWGPYTASPGTLTVTEHINATGCQVTTPVYSVILQQRPVPTLTGLQTVCDGTSGVVYQTEPLMSNYTWTIAGGSISSGGTLTSNSATVTWNTPGSQWIQVNYINGLGCPGFPAKQITVTVNPLPVSTIAEGPGQVCSMQAHAYNTTADPASTFTWSIIPAASGIITTGQGTSAISVDWQTSGPATLAVTATKTATNCSTSSTYPVLVHPSPNPAFSACFDIKTTPNAKKFTLKGGTPYLPVQGVYSGNRVTYNAGAGTYEFDPFGAAAGAYPITYTYTNTFGCTVASAPVTITVVNSAFTCNGDLTDVRDGKKYKTSLIGAKCWMRENLAYGTILDAALPQTDNCVNEKYCLPSDATCSTYGGLYQWDELMAYASTSANQGLCPPEWHIPTESEWQAMINAIVPGVTPPVDGYGGSFLKDTFLNPGFKALTGGIYYLNNNWAFTTGTLTGTMFWTSTNSGADRGVARGVNLINPSISKYPGSRGNAFSIRCVKD
ncbi:MAG: FISUMP domain-containing protein [Bacteroidota bacterium]